MSKPLQNNESNENLTYLNVYNNQKNYREIVEELVLNISMKFYDKAEMFIRQCCDV